MKVSAGLTNPGFLSLARGTRGYFEDDMLFNPSEDQVASQIEISVVILNYNGRRWLPRCFISLERQTIFQDLEVIMSGLFQILISTGRYKVLPGVGRVFRT